MNADLRIPDTGLRPSFGISAVALVLTLDMDTQTLAEFRHNKDEFFGGSHQSPLPHDLRHGFEGLKYFDANVGLELLLDFHPEEPTSVEIGTSDGQVRTYYRAGKIKFEVDGEAAELTVLRTPGHPGYFLPFRDATSGNESYGAGRYLDLEEPVDGKLHVDFNVAYNPYCAYSDSYSCALPPHENWLMVPIRAGEMTYK